ncbi:MAG: ABC transporter permease [Acidimicrobiia bacterium]|nr:ABC transporter permease [Acidimicrobiia bacterium]
MAVIKKIFAKRELTINLTLRELRTKYKRSVLGWAWSLINPLATAAIYTLVFSVFLKVEAPVGHPSGVDSFPLFLLCALLPFQFFNNTINTSIDVLLANGNLIKKASFPRSIFVLSSVMAMTLTLCIELGVLAIIFLIVGSGVIQWLPMVAVLIFIESFLVLGISLIVSVWNVYFRDMKYLVAIALQFLFYLTPVVYPITLVPKQSEIFGTDIPVRALYKLNPLVGLVESYRAVLYDLRFPALSTLLYVVAWSGAMVVIGFWIFGRSERRLAEEV